MAHISLEDVYELAWLPDGRNLILNGVDIPGASRQLWVLNGAELRRITNNLESYSGLSVSRDGSLVTVQQRISSSIWVSPDAATAPWKHFAIMADQDSFGLSWAPDGRIVHSRYGTGGNTEIWITNRDGSHARQLVAGLFKNIWPRVSGDGRYLVFASNRSGAYHLWRIGLDGGNLQQITRGQDESRFDISPDGQWVYFSSGEYQNRKLYKISIQGGSPIQLTNEPAAWPRVSPDGKWIALEVTIGHPTRRTIAVLPAAGGPVITRVKIDSWTPSMPFQWTRDGKALLYVRDGNGASNNVWRLPLAGGKPVPVTNFTGDEEIYWFDLTADGRQLACVRGVSAFDAVMIRAVR
jgi:Tol biopolymer transport system component